MTQNIWSGEKVFTNDIMITWLWRIWRKHTLRFFDLEYVCDNIQKRKLRLSNLLSLGKIFLWEEIFAEEIFVEFNFPILALIREIKFRETYNYCSIAKLNSAKFNFLHVWYFLTGFYKNKHNSPNIILFSFFVVVI